MEPDNISQKLQGLYLELRGLTRTLSSQRSLWSPGCPARGGLVFKLHYLQVDRAGAHGAFGVLTWGFLSNFHKQNKSDSGNGTIRTCYHQSQIFDDQPHRTRLGVSLSKLNTCAPHRCLGSCLRAAANPASHHSLGWLELQQGNGFPSHSMAASVPRSPATQSPKPVVCAPHVINAENGFCPPGTYH